MYHVWRIGETSRNNDVLFFSPLSSSSQPTFDGGEAVTYTLVYSKRATLYAASFAEEVEKRTKESFLPPMDKVE